MDKQAHPSRNASARPRSWCVEWFGFQSQAYATIKASEVIVGKD
jgi:hypothetical protein